MCRGLGGVGLQGGSGLGGAGLGGVELGGVCVVADTHLTLPTMLAVYLSVLAAALHTGVIPFAR